MSEKLKGTAAGVPVFCAYDSIVSVEEIKPNPKNPNQHPDEQIELLAKIIQKRGWRAPVTVSTLTGLVVRGHGRLMAAIHAGLEYVPVDYQHYDSEEDELSDLVADNRLAELAEVDKAMLAEIFSEIQDSEIGDFDITMSGYSDLEVEEIVSALEDSVMADIDEVKSKTEAAMHKLRFDSTVIPMTDEEYKKLKNILDEYVDLNSVVFGFVGWLLNDQDD